MYRLNGRLKTIILFELVKWLFENYTLRSLNKFKAELPKIHHACLKAKAREKSLHIKQGFILDSHWDLLHQIKSKRKTRVAETRTETPKPRSSHKKHVEGPWAAPKATLCLGDSSVRSIVRNHRVPFGNGRGIARRHSENQCSETF